MADNKVLACQLSLFRTRVAKRLYYGVREQLCPWHGQSGVGIAKEESPSCRSEVKKEAPQLNIYKAYMLLGYTETGSYLYNYYISVQHL
jgi:hypothetical protein